jgi:hypothetical protein
VVDLGRRRTGEGNRFLLFLAAQSFLPLFGSRATFIWRGSSYQADQVTDLQFRLQQLGAVLAFQNADCIQATLINTHELDPSRVTETVERLVKQASNQRIDRWLAGHPRQRGFLLTKLRLVLTEILENVNSL